MLSDWETFEDLLCAWASAHLYSFVMTIIQCLVLVSRVFLWNFTILWSTNMLSNIDSVPFNLIVLLLLSRSLKTHNTVSHVPLTNRSSVWDLDTLPKDYVLAFLWLVFLFLIWTSRVFIVDMGGIYLTLP